MIGGARQMPGMIRTLYILIVIIGSLMLMWLIAIPDEVIEAGIKGALSVPLEEGFKVSIEGVRKGPFFTIHMDSIRIEKDGEEIIEIRAIVSRPDSIDPFKGRLRLSFTGQIGDASITGKMVLPLFREAVRSGIFNIDGLKIDSIPYLLNKGIEGDGHLSAVIRLKGGEMDIDFSIPDLQVRDPGIIDLPLLETFHELQGTIAIRSGRIEIGSIGLEGEKGYARLKGQIMGERVDLELELMPYPERLTEVEAMLISRYEVSPGYYRIPVRGVFKKSIP